MGNLPKFKKIPTIPLSYDTESYYIEALDNAVLTRDEVLAEYKRLRKIGMSRLRGLKSAGYENSKTYKEFVGSFTSVTKFKKMPEHLQNVELHNIARFLQRRTSTASGVYNMHLASVNTLNKHGYDFVTMENIEQFGIFMGEVRDHRESLLYPSGRALAIFKEIYTGDNKVSIGKTKQAFKKYLKEHPEIDKQEEEYQREKSKRKNDSKSTRKRMKK